MGLTQIRNRFVGARSSRPHGARWGWLTGLAMLICATASLAAPEAQDIFENFEGFAPGTTVGVPFEIGPAGARAQFGGNAFAGENATLARSGVMSWLVVNAAADGTITFLDEPASEVEFYANVGSNPFGMIIRAFDPSDVQIGAPVVLGSGTPSTLVSFSGPVGRISVTNSDAGDLVSIDDFGYSVGTIAVPALGLPGLAVLVTALALGGWMTARRQGSALQLRA